MTAHAIPGELFIDPTNATTGGTQVVEIEDDRIEFDDRIEVAHFGSGLEADAWTTIRKPSLTPPVLIIPVRDVAAVTLQLLLSMLSTGTAAASHGGNSTPNHGGARTVALVVRPLNTGADFFYGPRWALHEENEGRIVWDRLALRYEGSVLMLAPHRSTDGSKKAWMLDSAANINTHYGL